MAYVPVPKDLSKVKSKLAFNLTKRQLLCFSGGALLGVPLFFFAKGPLGSSAAALCMILVCVSCYVMFLNIAMQLHDMFYKMVALGLGTCYIFQVFLTIGGETKFIPLTGVTVPLVSYGGSSLISTVIMFAIIQGLYILREQEGAHGKNPGKRKPGNKKAGQGKGKDNVREGFYPEVQDLR